jgi:hypothetical protein
MGWDDLPYQWAAAAYSGAIQSGRTICGELFGATVFLGALHGVGEPRPPATDNSRRLEAIAAAESLYRGFIERFGATECRALTGCDFSKEEDRARFGREQIFEHRCCKQLEYVLAACLGRIREESAGPLQP